MNVMASPSIDATLCEVSDTHLVTRGGIELTHRPVRPDDAERLTRFTTGTFAVPFPPRKPPGLPCGRA